MLGGAPFGTVSFGGLDGYDSNDVLPDWKNVDDSETTEWELIAA
jgi:hypothetical protein